MKLIEVNDLDSTSKKSLLAIWNSEYPIQLQHGDLDGFDLYLKPLINQKHMLLLDKSIVKGWYFEFDRDNARWFAMLLDQSIKNKGWGSRMLSKAKSTATYLSGWVIDHNNYRKANGETYKSPLGFYLKNGFKVASNQRLETGKISAVKIIWQSL
ncbi:MAG: N-acetyltransferase [Fulvivirga sp.]